MVSRISVLRRRPLFFYGWWIVLVGFFADFITSASGGYTFSVLMIPMSQSLGWSRSAMTSPLPLRTAVSILIAPLAGAMADRRHGVRLLLPLGGLVVGAGLLAISRMDHLWQFYFGYVLLGVGAGVISSQLVGTTLVSKWFVRRRGRAIALAVMGASAGGFVLAPLANLLLNLFDWRAAWLMMAALALGLYVPLAAAFVRRSPEDIGLHPDGDPDEPRAPVGQGQEAPSLLSADHSFTLRQAMATRSFWLVTLGQFLRTGTVAGLLVHLGAFLRDQGFSQNISVLGVTLVALGAFLFKPVWGLLAERVPVRYLSAVAGVGCAATVWVLLSARSAPAAMALAALYGALQGSMPVLHALFFADYFGRASLGVIRGVVSPVATALGGVAPFITAQLFERWGSYELAFFLIILLYLASSVVNLLSLPPRRSALF